MNVTEIVKMMFNWETNCIESFVRQLEKTSNQGVIFYLNFIYPTDTVSAVRLLGLYNPAFF